MPKRKLENLERAKPGGYKQLHESETLASHDGSSRLARFLLSKYFAGELSLPLVVTIASMAYDEPPKHPDVLKLSKLGTSGANINISARDLIIRLIQFPIEAALATIKLPMKVRGAVKQINFDMVYPHALFSKLFHHYPREFAKRFYGYDVGRISAFWRSQRDHPSYVGHAMHEHPVGDFRTKGCPLFVHGDDIASVGLGRVWARSVDCLSWGGLLAAPGQASEVHLIAWLVFICSLTTVSDGARTMQILWKHFTYSMYWLYRAVWPDRDVDGNLFTSGPDYDRALTPLADGFFGILWKLRGDQDWMQVQFHVQSPSENLPCALCRGSSSGPNRWTDCRYPGSGWLGEIWDRASHRAHFGDRLHRLFRVLPGFNITNYLADLLHCKWLGADQYFQGGVLALLTHHWLPLSPLENLRTVMETINEEYAKEGVARKMRYPKLSVNMYKGGKAGKIPKLKGTGVQCKGINRVMPQVFEKHMDATNQVHRKVLIGLNAIKEIDAIYHEHRVEFKLPPAASDRLIELSFLVAKVVSSLIKFYHPRRIPVFHYTIKQHYCLHNAVASKYTNPLLGDCSSGEDLMKTAKKLIAASVHGNGPAKAGSVAIRKYMKGLHLQMDAHSALWLR
jgi:hypothetical protein